MSNSTSYARYSGLTSAASGVASLDGMTGALTLVAGTGISIVDGSQIITISSTSAGDVTIGTANGLSLSAQVLSLALASTSTTGALSSADWNTFNGKQSALTFGSVSTTTTGVTVGSGSNSTVGPNVTVNIQTASTLQPGLLSAADWSTFNNKQNALTIGNLTDAGTDGITITGGTGAVIGYGTSIAQHVADTTHNGYLSSTDWNTFNGKQAALTIGNITDAGTDGITITGGTGAIIGSGVTISQHVADVSHNGYLASTDWSTFNSKQSALTFGSISTSTTGVTVGSGSNSTVGPNVTVNIQTASGAQPGLLSSTDWTTFNGKQSALTIGNLTDAGTDGITITGGTGAVLGSGTSISQHVADASHNGYLASTDWSTFNGKGSGTVTSVGLSVPTSSLFSVSNSPVTNSGTIALATTGTSGGIPYFSSTTQMNSSALLTASQLIIGGGAGVAPSTLAAGTQYQVLTMGASTPGYGAVNLAQAAAVTGTLPVAHGGTGIASGTSGGVLAFTATGTIASSAALTVNGVVIGGGAGAAPTSTSAGTAGNVLTSNGASTAPTFQPIPGTSNYVAKTSTYTANAGDFVNCTSGTFNVTLPTAASISGQVITIEQTGTGVASILTTSSQTVGGYASNVIKMGTPGDVLQVISDGSNWQISSFKIAVAAYYTSTAGNSVSASQAFNFEVKGQDPWSAVTTGNSNAWKFTAPVSGYYQVNANAQQTGSSSFNIQVYKNGSSTAIYGTSNGAVSFSQALVSGTIYLAANDYISANTNSTAVTMNTANNSISITRIGQ